MQRCIVALFAAASLGGLSPVPAAADTPHLSWTASIKNRSVTQVDTNDPLILSSDVATPVVIVLTNDTATTIKVRSARLEGRVMNMTFFRYTTRLDIVLAPGANTERRFDLDLDDLTGQSVGLIPARFQLLDDRRTVLAEDTFPVEVKGSLASVYGVFGLAVAGITGVLLATVLIALGRRRLPANRWKRALRFLAVGAGLALTLTFTLSATQLATPSATTWLPLVVVFTLGTFLLGYFLPLGTTPEPEPGEGVAPYDEVVGQHAMTDTDRWP